MGRWLAQGTGPSSEELCKGASERNESDALLGEQHWHPFRAQDRAAIHPLGKLGSPPPSPPPPHSRLSPPDTCNETSSLGLLLASKMLSVFWCFKPHLISLILDGGERDSDSGKESAVPLCMYLMCPSFHIPNGGLVWFPSQPPRGPMLLGRHEFQKAQTPWADAQTGEKTKAAAKKRVRAQDVASSMGRPGG